MVVQSLIKRLGGANGHENAQEGRIKSAEVDIVTLQDNFGTLIVSEQHHGGCVRF